MYSSFARETEDYDNRGVATRLVASKRESFGTRASRLFFSTSSDAGKLDGRKSWPLTC